jgi:hypothetical protein
MFLDAPKLGLEELAHMTGFRMERAPQCVHHPLSSPTTNWKETEVMGPSQAIKTSGDKRSVVEVCHHDSDRVVHQHMYSLLHWLYKRSHVGHGQAE